MIDHLPPNDTSSGRPWELVNPSHQGLPSTPTTHSSLTAFDLGGAGFPIVNPGGDIPFKRMLQL